VRHLRSLLGLMLCAVSVAGCTSDAAPVPAPRPSLSTPLTSGSPTGPSATPTPTPRETPTETPPPMPAAAKGDGRAAAKAFVRYYIQTFNFAEKTGRLAPLQKLSSTDCRACTRAIAFLKSTYRQGGEIRAGDGWTVRSLVVVPGETVVLARLHEDRVRWSTAPSAEPSFAEGHAFTLEIALERRAELWKVVEMEQKG